MKTQIGDLKDTGCITLGYPPELREAVVSTVGLWQRFCALPLEVKRSLPFESESGYEFKEGIGKNADRKENFELSRKALAHLLQNAEQISDPVALEFVQSVNALIDLIEPTVMDFARLVEDEYGIENFVDEVKESVDTFFPRFIHYFGDREMGEETAQAHVDQSGFTLHLFESGPGLQRMTFDTKEWMPMPVSSGETVIIPAMQLQLRSAGVLKATPHRVIAEPETVNSRFSAVCFVRLARTPVYDKDRCGRLQERLPGFNLEMEHDEFSQLFKSKS